MSPNLPDNALADEPPNHLKDDEAGRQNNGILRTQSRGAPTTALSLGRGAIARVVVLVLQLLPVDVGQLVRHFLLGLLFWNLWFFPLLFLSLRFELVLLFLLCFGLFRRYRFHVSVLRAFLLGRFLRFLRFLRCLFLHCFGGYDLLFLRCFGRFVVLLFLLCFGLFRRYRLLVSELRAVLKSFGNLRFGEQHALTSALFFLIDSKNAYLSYD
jgi:hypothetical protein